MDFPPHSHFDDIIGKLTSLHQENYVHGDVRNTNIMVKKDGNQRFKLIVEDEGRKTRFSNHRSFSNPLLIIILAAKI